MRIKAASATLSVPVPTLRRWTQEFAAGLSAEARANDGRPREFTARDMRILRRAKEILAREDITYQRARRELASEGLLQVDAAEPAASPASTRDDSADREAAEAFVRGVVERAVAPLRDGQAALAARIVELEREIRALRAAPVVAAPAVAADLPRSAAPDESDRRRSTVPDEGDRRRWPFRP